MARAESGEKWPAMTARLRLQGEWPAGKPQQWPLGISCSRLATGRDEGEVSAVVCSELASWQG